MNALESVLLVAILLAINAVYVAAEFGAVSARRSRILQLAEEGHRLARRLAPMLESPAVIDRWVAACQIGITVSSLVLGAYGEARVAPVIVPLLEELGWSPDAARSVSVVLVLVALTLVQMVVGELVPKSIALQFPTETALYTSLPMRWSLRLFSGLIALFNGTSRLVLRGIGVREAERHHVHSPEEIAHIIAESSSGGLFPPDAKQRLEQALRLSMREAGELMVPRARIQAIDVEAEEEEIVRAISGPFTRIPVFRGRFDEVVGLLHTKDVVLERLRTGRAGSVAQLMRPVLIVRPTDRADRILALLREHHTQFAVVRDRAGLVVGLLTLEDVLASVLGDVRDELEPPRTKPGSGERDRTLSGRARPAKVEPER